MGKNLKGKECGKGICQRKDGLYSARYVDELGKRHDKCLKDCSHKWCKHHHLNSKNHWKQRRYKKI